MIHKPVVQKTFLFIACLFWAIVFGLLLRAGIAAAPEYPFLAGLIGLALCGIACWLTAVSFK